MANIKFEGILGYVRGGDKHHFQLLVNVLLPATHRDHQNTTAGKTKGPLLADQEVAETQIFRTTAPLRNISIEHIHAIKSIH